MFPESSSMRSGRNRPSSAESGSKLAQLGPTHAEFARLQDKFAPNLPANFARNRSGSDRLRLTLGRIRPNLAECGSGSPRFGARSRPSSNNIGRTLAGNLQTRPEVGQFRLDFGQLRPIIWQASTKLGPESTEIAWNRQIWRDSCQFLPEIGRIRQTSAWTWPNLAAPGQIWPRPKLGHLGRRSGHSSGTLLFGNVGQRGNSYHAASMFSEMFSRFSARGCSEFAKVSGRESLRVTPR